MASRAVLLVFLAVTVVFAGCTDSDPEPAGPAGDAPADEPEPDPVADLIREAGVDVEPLGNAAAPGTLQGVVYSLVDGQAIDQASVFATCLRAELVPGFTQVATTNETGAFAFPQTGSFEDCLQLTYEVQAPGFTLQVPLSSGAIQDGTATIVHAGVVPSPANE